MDEFRYIDTYPVTEYRCGLRAGMELILLNDLSIKSHTGQITRTIPKDSVWLVLKGSEAEPVVVWLREPSGKTHTWDDDETVFEAFAIK